jgi:hypothetical protein
MMTIQEAMATATAEVMAEHNLSSARAINDNNCFDWAFKVFNLLPGSLIGGQRVYEEGQSYIVWEGLCYDSETPNGERYWWQLTTFRRMLEGSEEQQS